MMPQEKRVLYKGYGEK